MDITEHEDRELTFEEMMKALDPSDEEIREARNERRREARRAKKMGLAPKKIFELPTAEKRDEELPLEKDPNVLYGRVHSGDDKNPGIKLIAYLDAPASILNPRIRSTIEKYLNKSPAELMDILADISPLTYNKEERLHFYICNILLSKMGVAPRWRSMQRTASNYGEEWIDEVTNFNRDVQVFDLEWIRRQYPEHKVRSNFEGLFKHVMKSPVFDFSHAYCVASSTLTAQKKSLYLNLTDDMQTETVVIKMKNIKRRLSRLDNNLLDVRNDLIRAARKNRHRGKKLIDVIDDRLSIWLSAIVTEGISPTAMAETYMKMTGNKIDAARYMKRLLSTNDALREVASKFVVPLETVS